MIANGGSGAAAAAVTANIEHVKNINPPRGGGADFFFFPRSIRFRVTATRCIASAPRERNQTFVFSMFLIFAVTAVEPPIETRSFLCTDAFFHACPKGVGLNLVCFSHGYVGAIRAKGQMRQSVIKKKNTQHNCPFDSY